MQRRFPDERPPAPSRPWTEHLVWAIDSAEERLEDIRESLVEIRAEIAQLRVCRSASGGVSPQASEG
jgi:hypothetical protein